MKKPCWGYRLQEVVTGRWERRMKTDEAWGGKRSATFGGERSPRTGTAPTAKHILSGSPSGDRTRQSHGWAATILTLVSELDRVVCLFPQASVSSGSWIDSA